MFMRFSLRHEAPNYVLYSTLLYSLYRGYIQRGQLQTLRVMRRLYQPFALFFGHLHHHKRYSNNAGVRE
jgi:hypothetical protein